MQKMTEVTGKSAMIIKEMAHRFDEVFSEAFNDVPMRAAIWADPSDDNLICIRVLASDEDGNFVAYNGQYQVNEEEFFCDRKMKRAFINEFYMDKAVKALENFIASITKMKYAINKVLLDLNVPRYSKVKMGKSDVEQGAYVVHICTYLDEAKDAYGLVDAKKIVGAELASF